MLFLSQKADLKQHSSAEAGCGFQREPWLVASQTPDVCAAPAVNEAEQSEVVP